jgi:hypothetical protein
MDTAFLTTVLCLITLIVITYFVTRDKTSTPSLTATISNLVIASGPNTATQVISWDESGTVTSRDVDFISGSGHVNSIAETPTGAEASLTVDQGSATVRVYLNNNTSIFANLNLSNPCFLGRVRLITSTGAIQAKDIKVGMEMVQPDFSVSKVVSIKHSTLLKPGNNFDNDRLFADQEEKMVVTYWHKIKFIDEEEEVKAGTHPKLHEVTEPFPFDVYNFALEHYTHKLLLADVPVIAESFVPINPK